MMAEYIEIEAVKAVVKRQLGTMELFESIFNADIDAIPAADVAPVVRCKDCKKSFKKNKESKLNIFWCDKWKNIMRGDDFCSYGERKDGER